MARTQQTSTSRTVSRLLGGLAVVAAGLAVASLLFPDPLADAFFAGIVALSVPFALVGGIGAWTNRTPVVWAAALLLTGLSVLGMMSVGFALAPAALLLLGAAVFSQLAGPRADIREAIVSDPPTERELTRKKQVGIGSVGIGSGLVYAGAFAQELFGACASETLACALDEANLTGIGLTVVGLIALGHGGWLLWRRAYVIRVLAATRTR